MSLCIYSVLQQLEAPTTYAGVLLVDYSSAFNPILPSRLYDKLLPLGVQRLLCSWILEFLLERKQVVTVSKPRLISTDVPQGCVLSPLLYSLYTNDCTTLSLSVTKLKFASSFKWDANTTTVLRKTQQRLFF